MTHILTTRRPCPRGLSIYLPIHSNSAIRDENHDRGKAMPAKLYIRRGDDGTTGLIGGERVPKYDPRPEAYGTLDEASSVMGLARATVKSERSRSLLLESQRHLYCIMGELAATPETVDKFRCLGAEHVAWLEGQTDALAAEIQLPGEFIVPGDSQPG